MKITILGSGASSGTPAIETGWGDCDPENPKNRRTRPSLLIETQGKRLLIDTSPDLREQLLRSEVTHLDGVILTHGHADHLHGIDDIRGINRRMGAAIGLWADTHTLETVSQRFAYVVAPMRAGSTVYYKPTLVPHAFETGATFTAAGVEVTSFEQDHGFSTTHGLLFGNFAYTTDLVRLPEASIAFLKGRVDTWIVGAFAWHPHPTHLHIDAVLELRARLGTPRRTVITHMSNKIDYRALTDYLPEGVEAAYDGMVVEVPQG